MIQAYGLLCLPSSNVLQIARASIVITHKHSQKAKEKKPRDAYFFVKKTMYDAKSQKICHRINNTKYSCNSVLPKKKTEILHFSTMSVEKRRNGERAFSIVDSGTKNARHKTHRDLLAFARQQQAVTRYNNNREAQYAASVTYIYFVPVRTVVQL